MADDKLDIPDFLKVKNRKPLTPEQEAAVARAFARQNERRPLEFAARSSQDQAAAEKLREEQRQKKIAAMKIRLGKSKDKRPTGSVWDMRTSRWVMPNQPAPTPAQLIAEAREAEPTTKQIMEKLREERRPMSQKPEFSKMSGQQLLDEFNRIRKLTFIAQPPRKAKFKDRNEGVAACEKAWAAMPKAAPAPEKPKVPSISAQKPARAAPTGEKKPSGKLAMKIQIVTAKNPRREGTAAHRHYEEMRGGRTVAEYLAQFKPEDRRTAGQWLSNTVRDGHVKVVP